MRGFWYMLEAVMAGVIIIGFMIAVGAMLSFSPDEKGVSEKGYQELQRLADESKLRLYASQRNYSAIEDSVRIPGYADSVEICEPSGSCVGNVPSGEEVWLSTYIVSGYSSYDPVKVKLYLRRKE